MATHRQPGRDERSTVAGEAVAAFVPDPLPPPLELTAGLQEKVRLAGQSSPATRDRAFGYAAYLDRLRAGTELEGVR